jgi:hypothetical protein
MQASSSPDHRRIATVVPSVVGWRSNSRAWVNLLAFGIAVLVGTWIVHQTEYAIEYRSRFSTVMAMSPHRLYMAPAGVALGVAVGVLLLLCSSMLGLSRIRLGRLLLRLPPRLSRHMLVGPTMVSGRAIGRTALVLALLQAMVYVVQENLEYLASVGTLPGFTVLLASQHVTVIPLHLLAAACSSVLLWTVSTWLSRSRRALGMAEVLINIATHGDSVPPPRIPARCHLPNLRYTAGIFCLRSPPLST